MRLTGVVVWLLCAALARAGTPVAERQQALQAVAWPVAQVPYQVSFPHPSPAMADTLRLTDTVRLTGRSSGCMRAEW